MTEMGSWNEKSNFFNRTGIQNLQKAVKKTKFQDIHSVPRKMGINSRFNTATGEVDKKMLLNSERVVKI